MIQNVPEARRRILVLLVILLVLDICAVALLISPFGRSRTTRQDEYGQIRRQLEIKRRESLPARDMDKKLETSRQQIEAFYKDRVTARYSDISEQLGKLAGQNHIQIDGIHYVPATMDKGETPGATRVMIEATLAGDYLNEMKFINALERSKLLFVVDSVNLTDAVGGTVRLQVRFETYLRKGA